MTAMLERQVLPEPVRPTQAPYLQYIDCIRGYAIVLVITCHFAFVYAELPYPVHRVVVTGWFGVQLFFLASCITLMQSWHAELRRSGSVDIMDFAIRRVFRIAPAYYLAALVFGLSGGGGHGPWMVGITLGFLNGLSPGWAVASNGVVPGGWSIGTEFAFYAVFPLYASLVTSLRRALAAAAGAVVLGWAANVLALASPPAGMSADSLSNGLFFWFPNQASIFALGGVGFFLIRDHAPRIGRLMRGRNTAVALAAAAGFAALAYVPLGHYIGALPPVPASLAVSVVFLAGILALSSGPSLLSNRIIARMGTVSFSAYLLHYAVLDLLGAFPDLIGSGQTGYRAIAAFAAVWPVAVLLTYAAASVSYRLIELPMIGLGKSIIARRRQSRAAA